MSVRLYHPLDLDAVDFTVTYMTFTWAVELSTARNTTCSQGHKHSVTCDNSYDMYSSIAIQTSGLLLDPWLQCDNIAENWRSVGNGTVVGEAKVDNTVLEPAITLFTDKWTSGVTVARAFPAINCIGVCIKCGNSRQYDDMCPIVLPVPRLVSGHCCLQYLCTTYTHTWQCATLQKSTVDKMKVVISVASDERICNNYVLRVVTLVVSSLQNFNATVVFLGLEIGASAMHAAWQHGSV